MNRRTLLTIVFVCIILLVFVVLIFRKKPQKSLQPAFIQNVRVQRIIKSDVNDYFEVAGSVKAKDVGLIASRVMGSVKAVLVKEGDKVLKDQELLTIDSNDLEQRYKTAQAALDEAAKNTETAKANREFADTTFNRYKKLADEKVITPQDLDQYETRKKVADAAYELSAAGYQKAQAALNEAKVNLGFAHITSPTDGFVTAKKIDVGSMAMPGNHLLTVEDVSFFRLEANVDSLLAKQIKISTTIEATVETIEPPVKANITDIAPAIDTYSRTFIIKALINDEQNKLPLKTGLYARIKIPKGREKLLIIPSKAVVEKGQLTGVYVVDEKGVAGYRLIRIGKQYGSNVEVLSGLTEGQSIIVDGVSNAFDGGVVKDEGH